MKFTKFFCTVLAVGALSATAGCGNVSTYIYGDTNLMVNLSHPLEKKQADELCAENALGKAVAMKLDGKNRIEGDFDRFHYLVACTGPQ